jgi:hypothetical protein
MAKLATLPDAHGQQVLYELVHRLSEEHEAAWVDSIVQELVGAGDPPSQGLKTTSSACTSYHTMLLTVLHCAWRTYPKAYEGTP